MAPRRPSLIRFLFQAMLAVLVVRFVFRVARLLARGSAARRRPEPMEGGTVPPRASGRPRPRVDRSGVTDVPFTELPAPEPRPRVERS